MAQNFPRQPAHEEGDPPIPRDTALWSLMWETVEAIDQHVRPSVLPVLQESGLRQIPGAFIIEFVVKVAPEPAPAERMRYRNPYMRPAFYDEALQRLIAAGYVTSDYVATYQALRDYNLILAAQHRAVNALDCFDEAAMERLANNLHQALCGAMRQNTPETRCLRDSLRRSSPFDSRPVRYVYDAIWHLNAFRDDCHLSVWRPLGVDGAAWEFMTFLWQGGVDSPQAMAAAKPHHQRTVAEYAAALDELRRRGWAQQEKGRCWLTHEGQQVRQQAEDETNRLFYAAWTNVSHDAVADLRAILAALKDTLAQQS